MAPTSRAISSLSAANSPPTRPLRLSAQTMVRVVVSISSTNSERSAPLERQTPDRM